MHDVGLTVEVTRDAASLLSLIDTATSPVIVLLDWRVTGISSRNDLWHPEASESYKKLLYSLEERRASQLAGVIIALQQGDHHSGMSPVMPSVDAYLVYPFSPQELRQFIRRIAQHP